MGLRVEKQRGHRRLPHTLQSLRFPAIPHTLSKKLTEMHVRGSDLGVWRGLPGAWKEGQHRRVYNLSAPFQHNMFQHNTYFKLFFYLFSTTCSSKDYILNFSFTFLYFNLFMKISKYPHLETMTFSEFWNSNHIKISSPTFSTSRKMALFPLEKMG